MYNVKPFNCITTPNGTKMYLYLIGGRNYYGVSRLAKALGYSQFTTDSTLAAAFKDKRFYMSYAQISGGSARVADFDQLVPLLEHFIKLSLNITPNSDAQTMTLDNARMEAQRLIELLKKAPVVKQPEPAQIKSEPVETNLFGELVEHDDPQSITVTQVDTVDTPIYPLRIFKDKSDERYIAFYDLILAIGYGGPKSFSGPIGQTAAAYCQIKFATLDSNVNARVIPLIPFVKNFATTNARLNHINKNIKANLDNVLNILANHFGIERTPNIDVVASKVAVKATTKVTKVPAIKLQDVGILSPALGEWIDKEVLPMLTEQTAPTPADLDKEIATYSSKLLELEQAKFDRDINELNTQILSFRSEVNDLLTKIQTITDQANELAEKCEALEREREDKIKQFERKQALYKEMFS